MSNYHRDSHSTTMATTATLDDRKAFFFASTTMQATENVAMSFGFDEPETGATRFDGGGDDGLCCCDAAMWQKMSNYHRGLNSTTMTTTATLNDQEAFFFASTTMLATENVAMSFGFDELKVVWFNVLNDACCLLLAVAAGCCCLLLAVCW